MTVQIFMAISKYRFNCRSNNRTNMELNSANKNPSHDSFIVCIDKQAYKLSLQITKNAGPLADSYEIKGFYKGYFRQNKGCFTEILTKIKSKLTSNFLVFFIGSWSLIG